MNYGLAQGYVKFGGLAHKILKIALEERSVNQSNLSLRFKRDNISTTLKRLVEYKFLYEVGRTKLDHVNKSCKVFALHPNVKVEPYNPPSKVERNAKLRRSKGYKVSSVFDWRGKI